MLTLPLSDFCFLQDTFAVYWVLVLGQFVLFSDSDTSALFRNGARYRLLPRLVVHAFVEQNKTMDDSRRRAADWKLLSRGSYLSTTSPQ